MYAKTIRAVVNYPADFDKAFVKVMEEIKDKEILNIFYSVSTAHIVATVLYDDKPITQPAIKRRTPQAKNTESVNNGGEAPA